MSSIQMSLNGLLEKTVKTVGEIKSGTGSIETAATETFSAISDMNRELSSYRV